MIIRRPALERDVLDGMVVLGADSTGPPLKLNGTAASVWSTLERPHTFDALVSELASIYATSAERIRLDVETALALLVEHGLIKR